MHTSVLKFLSDKVDADDIRGMEVLEVGSMDVNGSPRNALRVHGPKRYVGVDALHGKGVDIVLDAREIGRYFGSQSFDVVISTEMLEHAHDWRTIVANMKYVLRPGGLLIVTTRSPGFPYHAYPNDYWRYTLDDFKKIFFDMWIQHLGPDHDPKSPGVFMKARKTGGTGSVNLAEIDVAAVR